MVNPLHDLGVGMAQANEANQRAQSADQRAASAALDAATANSRRIKTDATLQKERDEAVSLSNNLLKSLGEKDALILEWMHTNEAFKQLAKKYRAELGIGAEAHQLEFDDQILKTAEANPKFQQTTVLGRAKERLAKGPKG